MTGRAAEPGSCVGRGGGASPSWPANWRTLRADRQPVIGRGDDQVEQGKRPAGAADLDQPRPAAGTGANPARHGSAAATAGEQDVGPGWPEGVRAGCGRVRRLWHRTAVPEALPEGRRRAASPRACHGARRPPAGPAGHPRRLRPSAPTPGGSRAARPGGPGWRPPQSSRSPHGARRRAASSPWDSARR